MIQPVEVVVVGGGPAGLSAALAAAQAGAQVRLLDGYAQPGGQYYHQPPRRERPAAQVGQTSQPAALPEELDPHASHKQREGRALWRAVVAAGVEIQTETLVWDVSGDRRLAIVGPNGAGALHPQALILATGAYERVVPFPGWTLPGVMTSGAAQSLLYQNVRPGSRVLLAGAGPLQLTTAAELLKAGVPVAAVLEGARALPGGLAHAGGAWGQWGRIREGTESLLALARHGVPYRLGWGIVAAQGTHQVESVTIARLDKNWRPIPSSQQEVPCDTLCMGYGFVPFHALARLAGAKMAWRPELGGEVPLRDDHMQTSLPGIYAVGDGAGLGGYRMSMLEGQVAGLAAAAQLELHPEQAEKKIRALAGSLARERAFQALYGAVFTPGPGIYELAREDTLVCRCEGVTLSELRQAVLKMDARTAAEAKNITRCGMGECQGRVCGSMVTHTIARLLGTDPEVVGLNAPRPPVFPMPLARFCDAERDLPGADR